MISRLPRNTIFSNRIYLPAIYGMLVCLFIPMVAVAQDRGMAPQNEGTEATPLQIGLGLWGFDYQGDLSSSSGLFQRVYPGFDASLQFEGKRRLGMQFHAGYGRIIDQSEAPPVIGPEDIIANTFVETPFFYTDVRLRLYIRKQGWFKPYLSAGTGLLFFWPMDEEGNFLGENIFTRLPEEEYSTTVVSVPLSAGVMARISSQVNLGISYTYRLVPTDYIDNISKLGATAGNDRLHGIGVSLYLTLKSAPIARPPETEPIREEAPAVRIPDLLTLQVENEWMEESLIPEKIPLRPEMDSTVLLRIRMRSEEQMIYERLWKDALEGPTESEFASVEPDRYQGITSEPIEGKNLVDVFSLPTTPEEWLSLEEEALLERKYIQVITDVPATLNRLSNTYHIRATTIKRLNPQLKSVIPAGTTIKIPDLGVKSF